MSYKFKTLGDIKFSCPKCGGHLVIDERGAGVEVSCGHCNARILVPKPPAQSATRPPLSNKPDVGEKTSASGGTLRAVRDHFAQGVGKETSASAEPLRVADIAAAVNRGKETSASAEPLRAGSSETDAQLVAPAERLAVPQGSDASAALVPLLNKLRGAELSKQIPIIEEIIALDPHDFPVTELTRMFDRQLPTPPPPEADLEADFEAVVKGFIRIGEYFLWKESLCKLCVALAPKESSIVGALIRTLAETREPVVISATRAQMFGEPADEMRIQMRTLFAQEHAGLADEIRKGCRRTACLALGVIGSPYADSAKHMLEAIAADEDEAPEVRNQVVFNAVLTLTARSKDKDSASSVRESLVQLARDKTRKRKEEEREKREEAERSEREYRIQSDRRARGQCIMCGKRLGFVLRAFRRTTHAHCTSFSEGAKPKTVAEPTQAKPTPAASPIPSGQPPPAKTVTCPACGHVQRKGDWEREMDKRAKAQGMKGFVNLSAPPQCLKCEAALDGSDTKKQEVSGVCDICNRATSTGSGGKVFKNKEMKRATERGFNGMAIGPNARMLAVVGISKNETYGQWKQKVTLDTTDWLLCPECQKEIRNYM